MNVNKGYVVLGHYRRPPRAAARSRAGWAEWKRIRPCKLAAAALASFAWLPTPRGPLDLLTQAQTYVRVYHFRARALQIYHPARENRRKAIFVLLGLCSRRCSNGQVTLLFQLI